jgi:hypothetical protein
VTYCGNTITEFTSGCGHENSVTDTCVHRPITVDGVGVGVGVGDTLAPNETDTVTDGVGDGDGATHTSTKQNCGLKQQLHA